MDLYLCVWSTYSMYFAILQNQLTPYSYPAPQALNAADGIQDRAANYLLGME